MREVEAKIVLGDCTLLEAIEDRVKRLGGVLDSEVYEKDLYFQHPCRDFAQTDEALRLREEGGRCTLTYKGPKEGGRVKARLEVNVEVGDCNAARLLLERLGFRPVAVVAKKRRYYSLGDVEVALDEVEGLGCFVEVESRRGREEDVIDAVRRLGLEKFPTTTKSYLELLIEKMGSGFREREEGASKGG